MSTEHLRHLDLRPGLRRLQELLGEKRAVLRFGLGLWREEKLDGAITFSRAPILAMPCVLNLVFTSRSKQTSPSSVTPFCAATNSTIERHARAVHLAAASAPGTSFEILSALQTTRRRHRE